MQKHWLPYWLVVIALLAMTNSAVAQNDVTFQVNMKIKMLEGGFVPGSGDIVRVAGSFNDWGNSTDTLTDPNNDSIYTKTISLAEGAIQYKFLKTFRAGSGDWESVSNRQYSVAAGSQTIPVVYFDDDSVANLLVSVNFQVDMSVKMLEQAFLPGSGDIVRIAANFNGWQGSTDTLKDPDNDSIYTKTVTLNEGYNVQYKYLKTPRAGLDWESGSNRSYDVPVGGGAVPLRYFDDDSVAQIPVSGNIVWRVDMRAYEALGWFRPDLGDSIEVRGGFNSWGGTKMAPDPFEPGRYELLMPYTGVQNDVFAYKYFMDFDSAGATDRFPGYIHGSRDGYSYSHPAERGDGNRLLDLGMGGDIYAPLVYFSSISPSGLLGATDTVDVTLGVNMGPATRDPVPFNPLTDTVKLNWEDALWRSIQVKYQGSFPQEWIMTPVSPGDSIYTVTFRVIGPTHYNMQYRFRYVQPGGFALNQGGGLGVQNPFNSRFIQPAGFSKRSRTLTTVWPRTYTAPTDEWKRLVPLNQEPIPFDYTAGSSATFQIAKGWNMLSLPVGVEDGRKSVLFPTSTSRAFKYQGMYVQQDTLRLGIGYWLKFGSAQAPVISGDPLMYFNIPVVEGWNLIGSVSQPVPADQVTSDPPGITTSSFFGYVGRYQTEDTIKPGKAYWVKVSQSGQLYLSGSSAAAARIKIVPTAEFPPAPPEGDALMSGIPEEFNLEQNYPNPFNPATAIRYALPVDSYVTLNVYNGLGQKVATPIDGVQPAGYQSVDWNATNRAGAQLASGVYFYVLKATGIGDPQNSFTKVMKMIVVR